MLRNSGVATLSMDDIIIIIIIIIFIVCRAGYGDNAIQSK
jgi:hypothetical protein